MARNKKIISQVNRPRLSVEKTNKHLRAQLIDDQKATTLVHVNDNEIKNSKNPTDMAEKLGKLLAEKAAKVGIKEIIFDRRNHKYHGRIASFAEAIRNNGINF